MSYNATSGDCSPSSSRPSTHPKTAVEFQSYAEYLAHLGRNPIEYPSDLKETLWLASFNDDGGCITWYHCRPWDQETVRTRRYPPAVDESGVEHDTPILSSSEFQTLLQATNEDEACRLVIVTAGFWGHSSQVEDILGLGLDLEPEIFDFVKSRVEAKDMGLDDGDFPMPWFRDCPALSVGHHVLCMLETTPMRKSKTAIMFLRERFKGVLDHEPEELPRYAYGSTMLSLNTPSQTVRLPNPKIIPSHRDWVTTWLVRRFIDRAIDSNDLLGTGSFLYICLAALLELHLSTAPSNEPYIGFTGLMFPVFLKYRGVYIHAANRHLRKPFDPGWGWPKLRNELDEQRVTLRWMTRFFRKHFDYSNPNLREALEDFRERFELRVQDLEQAELKLRDHVAKGGIEQSYRMAELSIRESKRVMILSALASIFLPISLASSVL